MNLAVDIFFCMDVILNFFTSKKSKEGKYITNLKTLAVDYIYGWFLFDSITSIPF